MPSFDDPARDVEPRRHHTCPVWVGWLLACPLRRLVENPITLLGPYVRPGSTVVDVGAAMGFHSLDLARMVGVSGRVVSLDIQREMLDRLTERARRKGLDRIIETRLCSQESLEIDDLHGEVDLVTAFNVVHETSLPRRFLEQCADALRPGGRLFIAEPRGHVVDTDFEATVSTARSFGLSQRPAPHVWRSHSAVLERPR